MAAVSNATKGAGHEWNETDWSSDGHDLESPAWQNNWYGRSKVDTEHLVNDAAAASGKWDAITMNPAMITGPILFKAQNGQWIEQIGRLAGGLEPTWPSKNDMYYDLIDVRDLVGAHRLAMESTVDHVNSLGGPRYVMHGSGGYVRQRHFLWRPLTLSVSDTDHKHLNLRVAERRPQHPLRDGAARDNPGAVPRDPRRRAQDGAVRPTPAC